MDTEQQSFALLETVFAQGPTGFAFVDQDFRYVRINERLAEINSRSIEQHLGHTVEEVIGSALWQTRRHFFERALAGEATLDVQLPVISISPSPARHILASYLSVRSEGMVIGVAVIVHDITPQVQMEEALRSSEARKATILEVALDCIITIDGTGRIIEFNPAAEQTFGYTREEAIGATMAELIVPPALRAAHYHGFGHYLSTGEGPILRQRIEVTTMRKGGEEFPIELAVVPIEGEGGVLFTAYLRDISDRQRDLQERQRLLCEVEASAERQRAFLRDVLASVTEGKLRLCHTPGDLPLPLPPVSDVIALSVSGGTPALRYLTKAAAQSLRFSEERCYDLVTAVSEAAMNAAIHAGGGEGRVHAGEEGPVQVWVQDQGQGIDVAHLPRATLEKGYTTVGTLGHGMKMMLQTVDRIFLLTGATGTTIVLEQDRTAAPLIW